MYIDADDEENARMESLLCFVLHLVDKIPTQNHASFLF